MSAGDAQEDKDQLCLYVNVCACYPFIPGFYISVHSCCCSLFLNSAFNVAFTRTVCVNSLLLYFFVHHIVVIFVSDDFNGG